MVEASLCGRLRVGLRQYHHYMRWKSLKWSLTSIITNCTAHQLPTLLPGQLIIGARDKSNQLRASTVTRHLSLANLSSYNAYAMCLILKGNQPMTSTAHRQSSMPIRMTARLSMAGQMELVYHFIRHLSLSPSIINTANMTDLYKSTYRLIDWIAAQ